MSKQPQNSSRNAINAKPNLDTNPVLPPAAVLPSDPPDFALQLWGLRLWILVALVIIAVALGNYLLNWIVK